MISDEKHRTHYGPLQRREQFESRESVDSEISIKHLKHE